MEVIHKFDSSDWQEDVLCDHCWTEALVNVDDILFNKKVRYSLYVNYLDDYFYVHCPVCNAEVEVDAYLMPDQLQQQISSKYNVVVPEKKIGWRMWTLITCPVWMLGLLFIIFYFFAH